VHDVISSKYFSLIVDEATDSRFKDQVSICLRHVNIKTLGVHKDLVGLYETRRQRQSQKMLLAA